MLEFWKHIFISHQCIRHIIFFQFYQSQLDFIGAFLQAKVKNRVYVKLDSRYADYFPEYSNYFRIFLILLKHMYGMTNAGKLVSDELTQWLLEASFIQSKCQISNYYTYAPY